MTNTTLLAILQQSEYDFPRFARWVEVHKSETLTVQPEKWTAKLKIIQLIGTFLFFLPPLWRIKVALLMTQPLEFIVRQQNYAQAQNKLAALRRDGLVVIAVAGSYGKTSIKQQLQATIGHELPTLVTPKSINTMLGISRVIMKDLLPHHRVFVAEIGEFKPGQVAELMHFLKPDWGVLSPIGHQHLELLGSYEHVIQEFKDFVAYFPKKEQVLIAEQNAKILPDFSYYGQTSTAEYRLTEVTVSRAGTEYQVHLPTTSETLKVFTPLYGAHQASNSLPAFWLATKLKIDPTKVAKQLATISYIQRRHEPTFAERQVLLLDNSYNTNPDSIRDSLTLLNQLEATHRIMITAGFVEQGEEAQQNHYEFGKLAAHQLDYLGLFNAPYEADIVRGFTEGGGHASQIKTGRSQTEVLEKLQPEIIPGTVVIFEGGYQEIHS